MMKLFFSFIFPENLTIQSGRKAKTKKHAKPKSAFPFFPTNSRFDLQTRWPNAEKELTFTRVLTKSDCCEVEETFRDYIMSFVDWMICNFKELVRQSLCLPLVRRTVVVATVLYDYPNDIVVHALYGTNDRMWCGLWSSIRVASLTTRSSCVEVVVGLVTLRPHVATDAQRGNWRRWLSLSSIAGRNRKGSMHQSSQY